MTKRHLLIALCLFLFALALRIHNYPLHAPFDWDQDRDYGAVKQIAQGDLLVLGPIAKGVGGFYLGSLYYYLLYPAFFLMSGSLSALPLTSLMIDSLVVALIYLLLIKFLGSTKALVLALLWASSHFVINASHVSWNVALVPLWSLLTLYAFASALSRPSSKYLYLLGLLWGLSTHIHVAIIPLIPILTLFFIKRLSLSLSTCLKCLALALLPVLPLILFDLKHDFLNLHLLLFQTKSHILLTTPLLEMTQMALTKLGKVASGLYFANFANNLGLGILLILLAIKATWSDHSLLKVASVMLLLSFCLVVSLRDYGFPEYYFASAYLSLFILGVTALFELSSLLPKPGYLLLGLSLASFAYLNYHSYTSATYGVFSLGVKQQIVRSLHDLPPPLDLHYDFDPGRDGGLRYLVNLEGIKLDPQAKHRVILTDKIDSPAYIDGELGRDLLTIGKIKTSLYVVQ